MYSSPTLRTVIAETVLRDRIRVMDQRIIQPEEIETKRVVSITGASNAKLVLLNLMADGCLRAGISTDAIRAIDHSAGHELGRAIHSDLTHLDGVIFPSRFTGDPVCAISGRSTHKLRYAEEGPLGEYTGLEEVLTRYRVIVLDV